MKILITGGTGALGRQVAGQSLRAGMDVRVMSRARRPAETSWDWTQADLASGDGVRAALNAVDVVVHAASDPKRQQEVDVRGTQRLIDAARQARIQHIVYVSIVGIDHIPYSYYRRKLEAERFVESSGIPFTIVRATQFHSFIDAIFSALARTPLILPVPKGFKVQSVAVEEVAARIVQVVAAGPLNGTINFAGPEVLMFEEMAERWLSARQLGKRLVRIPLPGATARAFEAGRNTAPTGERGAMRRQDWLAQTHAPDYGV